MIAIDHETDGTDMDGALDPELDRISRRSLLGRVGAAVAAVSLPGESGQKPPRALDDPKLDRQMVIVPVSNGNDVTAIQGFLARPGTPGKRGGILVIHEIFGLTDHIKDVTCRLAQAGFDALALNLFTREGAPPALTGGFEPLMQFVGKITDAQIMGDLDAGAAYLRERPESNGRIGVVGFCWGGRMSMLYNAHSTTLAASAAYYGRITGTPTANQPHFPLDLAPAMNAPLLGHFGGKDQSIPTADVDQLRSALEAAHKTASINTYSDAGHAFNNDTRESYVADAAHLAWKRTLEWFDRYVQK